MSLGLFLASVVFGATENNILNLAHGKVSVLCPAPNYRLCSDPCDKFQLTDGNKKGSDWGKKSTVGWIGSDSIPNIEIDLEEYSYIREINIYTIGGGVAGVDYPDYIVALVSPDGKEYTFAGLVDSSDYIVPGIAKKKQPLTLTIKNINYQARYVRLICQISCQFLFIDEIEVMGEKDTRKLLNRRFGNISNIQAIKLGQRYVEIKRQARNLLDSIEKFGEKFNTKFLLETEANIKELLVILKETANNINDSQLEQFENGLGLIKAKIYRTYYGEEVVLLPAVPDKILNKSDLLLEKNLQWNKDLEVIMWQDEFEPAAINIINGSSVSKRVSVQLESVVNSEEKEITALDNFIVRRALYVYGKKIGEIADALIIQNDYPFLITPGLTSQIWLNIKSSELKPDNYIIYFRIITTDIDSNISNINKIKISLKILPLKLQNKGDVFVRTNPLLFTSSITKNFINEAIEDLKSHYENMAFIYNKAILFPSRIKADGQTEGGFDFSKLDYALSKYTYAKKYIFFLGYKEGRKNASQFGEWMSDSWRVKYSFWLRALVEHLKERKIDYKDFYLFGFDETLCNSFYEWVQFVKRIDPNIQIYANSFGQGPKDFEKFRDLIDVWNLPGRICEEKPDWLAKIQSYKTQIWTGITDYPGKANLPYNYYRMIFWKAFKRSQKGVAVWAYVDNDCNDWDDTLTTIGYYGMVYGSNDNIVNNSEKIIPSRRWEIWRQGVEDYLYLLELKNKIDILAESGQKDQASEYSKKLNSLVSDVLQNQNDYEKVYCARKTISEILMK